MLQCPLVVIWTRLIMSHCSFFLSLFFIYIYFFFLCLWTFKLQCLKDISYILLLCGWKWTHRNLKWCPNLYSMRGALTPVLHSLASNFWILSWVILIFFFLLCYGFFPHYSFRFISIIPYHCFLSGKLGDPYPRPYWWNLVSIVLPPLQRFKMTFDTSRIEIHH